MTVIVCVDNRGGVAFNGRRQSRDSVISDDIIKMSEGRRLVTSEYSSKLIGGTVTEDYGENDVVFRECESVAELVKKASEVIVYCFNRDYPADTYSDFDGTDFNVFEEIEFSGTSHEKITKTTYRR